MGLERGRVAYYRAPTATSMPPCASARGRARLPGTRLRGASTDTPDITRIDSSTGRRGRGHRDHGRRRNAGARSRAPHNPGQDKHEHGHTEDPQRYRYGPSSSFGTRLGNVRLSVLHTSQASVKEPSFAPSESSSSRKEASNFSTPSRSKVSVTSS